MGVSMARRGNALLPRIVFVSDDQWLRAGLRAELRERGYDAIGARDVAEAARTAKPEAGRGPVRLVLVDQASLGDELDADAVRRVHRATWNAPMVLIASGNRPQAQGEWTDVLRRPITIGEIADYVSRALPHAHADGPLDK